MILLDVPGATSRRRRCSGSISSSSARTCSSPTWPEALRGVWVHGPAAPRASCEQRRRRRRRAVGDWPRLSERARREFNGAPVVVARIDQLGVPGFCVYVDAGREAALRRRAARGRRASVADEAALEAARIEAGLSALRRRHDRRHHSARGRHRGARDLVHEGLLRRAGSRSSACCIAATAAWRGSWWRCASTGDRPGARREALRRRARESASSRAPRARRGSARSRSATCTATSSRPGTRGRGRKRRRRARRRRPSAARPIPSAALISSSSAGGNPSDASSPRGTHRISCPSSGRGVPTQRAAVEVERDGPLGIGVRGVRTRGRRRRRRRRAPRGSRAAARRRAFRRHRSCRRETPTCPRGGRPPAAASRESGRPPR